MELVDGLDQAFDHTHQVISGIRPEQMADPTPCSEWDVRALLTHVVGVATNLGAAAKGQAPAGSPNDLPLSDDPAAQYRAAADAALDGFRAPGALEKTMDAGPGPLPGSAYAGILLLDTATHSWDLAQATGQESALDPACARLALDAARQIVNPDLRPGRFGPEVPVGDDAGPTEQLVAFLGRQP